MLTKPFRWLCALTAVLVVSAAPLYAQATLNQTTLNGALTAGQKTVTLTSGTTVVAGQTIYIEQEAMTVNDATNSPTFAVQRGQSGTAANAHPTGAIVYTGPGLYLSKVQDQSGACTAANEVVLPVINLRNGNAWYCTQGRWMAVSFIPKADPSPRVNVANGTYTIKLTDRIVSLSTTGTGSGGVATAVNTWTLPAVTSALVGKELWVKDESGGVTGTTYVALAGTVDGLANNAVAQLKTAYGALGLYAGSNGWFTFSCFKAGCI